MSELSRFSTCQILVQCIVLYIPGILQCNSLLLTRSGIFKTNTLSNYIFTITAEINACSLANFYGQYVDRHMNLKFMPRVSERELAIRQFVIVKNKLTPIFMHLSCY